MDFYMAASRSMYQTKSILPKSTSHYSLSAIVAIDHSSGSTSTAFPSTPRGFLCWLQHTKRR
jgi:hypothetical protein